MLAAGNASTPSSAPSSSPLSLCNPVPLALPHSILSSSPRNHASLPPPTPLPLACGRDDNSPSSKPVQPLRLGQFQPFERARILLRQRRRCCGRLATGEGVPARNEGVSAPFREEEGRRTDQAPWIVCIALVLGRAWSSWRSWWVGVKLANALERFRLLHFFSLLATCSLLNRFSICFSESWPSQRGVGRGANWRGATWESFEPQEGSGDDRTTSEDKGKTRARDDDEGPVRVPPSSTLLTPSTTLVTSSIAVPSRILTVPPTSTASSSSSARFGGASPSRA